MFRCPKCGHYTLRISHRIALPYDCRSDEIMLQIARCHSCRFEAVAVYEESRRGALDDESVDHRGYFLSREIVREVKAHILKCRNKLNVKCGCAAHQTLGQKDEFGCWRFTRELAHNGIFPMTR